MVVDPVAQPELVVIGAAESVNVAVVGQRERVVLARRKRDHALALEGSEQRRRARVAWFERAQPELTHVVQPACVHVGCVSDEEGMVRAW